MCIQITNQHDALQRLLRSAPGAMWLPQPGIAHSLPMCRYTQHVHGAVA